MVKPIIKDVFFLSQKSEEATKADLSVARDLVDTLKANIEHCVGMAANMIGVKKRIIVCSVGSMFLVMLNPKITKTVSPYETEEGCLSLDGVRKTMRYETIEVAYQTLDMQPMVQGFSGWTAQIIQHEVDHCNGILI